MKKIPTLLLLFVLLCLGAMAQDKMTNDDVLKLLDAKVRQPLIVQIVTSTPGTYSLTPDDVKTLKHHGAKEQLLDAMKRQNAMPPPADAAMVSSHHHLKHSITAFAAHANSITAETCEEDISTSEDCHANHPTGCTDSNTPQYDAYLNFLKNQLIDPDTVPEKVLSQSDLNDREANLPDTLTSRNHGDHANELAQEDEGKVVTIVGTLFYAIHSGQETCNCKLAGSDDVVDFHIGVGFGNFPLGNDVLTALRSGSIRTDAEMKQEFTAKQIAVLEKPSFIVEMTPHFRAKHPELGWTLDAVQKAVGHKVRITGQLMVDNAHHTRGDDCGLEDATRKCWRATIWEIHPVTKLEVCRTDSCTANSNDWVALKDF